VLSMPGIKVDKVSKSASVLASFIDCLCSYNESRKCVSDLENEQMPSSMIEGIMAINDIVY
jgi:hypothetical protein